MVDFVTSNTHQSVPATGQQVLLLAAYSGTAAVTGATSAKVGSIAKAIQITLSNITSVGAAAITLQATNDVLALTTPASATWTTLTNIVSTSTTQATFTTLYTDTTPWSYYRVNTGANASTNTMTVVLSF